ncbi:hypothetical protein [Brachyspira hampsonii]|uniref:hypothetical protein n=1 Tax=Brachyspira hampsonii TaxID=1287055 RepID=UPI000D3862B1|nr:hypothetical protein [Brachyspira hampsonii]PTY41412.1 hypothetical protein DQ06_13185 [Brachyspira hampsonii bv. II]
MKRNYIFLLIVFIFIASCGNKITSPSENINGIVYYDSETAETKYFSFYKIDGTTGEDFEAKSKFKKLAESQNAIIYFEDGYSFTRDQLRSFTTQFEESYKKEISIYGEPSDLDRNGKIIFLMADINTNGNSIGGYFDPNDLIYGKDGIRGEYLHVNFKWEFELIFAVMMHELQHLINYNVNVFGHNKDMDIWLNEALSESTSHTFNNIFVQDRVQSFNEIPYYSFYSWYLKYEDETDIFGQYLDALSYSPASMFMKWIDTKTGGNQEVYRKIASSTIADSEQRLVNSVNELAPSLGSDMNTLLINYISDIYNGNNLGLNVSPIPLSDSGLTEYLTVNGQLPLVPKALVVCSAEDANKITDSKITKTALKDGNYLLLNTSKNATPGFVAANNVVGVSITLPQSSKSLSVKYSDFKDLTIFKDNYFKDVIIKERD